MDIAVPTLEDIAAILALAPPDQPWKLEGPCRHRIRAILILTRWTRSWHRADLEARRRVARGRLKNGVRMPAGWDADPDLSSWVGSIECAICGKTVLQKIHNQIYCSVSCKSRANYIGATKQRLRRCSRCGDLFEGRTVEAKYCSRACAEATKRERMELTQRLRRGARRGVDLYDRPCAICGGHIPETYSLLAEFCSDECRHENTRRWKRANYQRRKANGANGHARPNGNGHAHDSGGHDRDHEDPAPARAGPPGGTALAAAPAAPGGEAT